MQTLTGSKKGIMKLRSVPYDGPLRRGSETERYKVIGTLHPAAVMRSQDFWPAVVFDLHRAQNESMFPDIRRRQWSNTIHAKLIDVKDRLVAQMKETGAYFHDLETTGLDPRTSTVRCIGLSGNDKEIYVFDWTSDVQEFVSQIHEDPTLMTVGQNSEGFDIPYQEHKGFKFVGPTYDTLIGWHQLNSSLPKDLGFIGATVTDEPYWKDETMYRSGEDALQLGCGKDIYATARAAFDQWTEMKALNQWDLYFNHIMPVQPVLRRMTKRGMKKDINRAARWHVALNEKADALEARLRKGLGDTTFNVNSPAQLSDLLYKKMGLPVQYKETPNGLRPSVDADALEDLARISRNPILLLVRDIRTLRKWDSTFVMCPMDEKQYVHGRFSTAKAANGRLNSFDPNMQNFPVEVREIFVPDSEDHVFFSRDWSQIEWRVAMTLSGDKAGLDAIVSGRDAHKDAFANAFGVPYDQVTKKQRFDAKTINFGVLYGRGVKSLAEGKSGGRSGASRSKADTAIPEEVVRDYLPRFFAKFNGYDKFRKEIERQVTENHYVSSAWGRRRYWYTRRNMPEAYNFPISSTAASMMYEALVDCEAQLPKGSELRLTVHDELVIHCVKEQKILQQAIDCTRDIMEKSFRQLTEASLYPDTVRHYYPNGWYCPTDVHLGETWMDCKGEDESLRREQELVKKLGVTMTKGR